MRNFLILSLIWSLISGFGCSSRSSNSVDATLDPSITQPPLPDPNTIAGRNPRDPKNRKIRPDTNPSATPEPSTPKPAAENSMASVIMNADGSITEFRVFKDHPQILKAEANWLDPTDKTLRVFLKNGKILTAKTDKIPYLHTVTSELILEVVGITSGAVKGDRPRVVIGK